MNIKLYKEEIDLITDSIKMTSQIDEEKHLRRELESLTERKEDAEREIEIIKDQLSKVMSYKKARDSVLEKISRGTKQ